MRSVIICFLFFASLAQAAPKIVGNLGLISGEVYLDQNRVTKNAPVREGAVIETKEGTATLLLGKGSVLKLGPNSKMVVNQFNIQKNADEDGELELKFGRTRALILNQGTEKKDLKIKARAATMGVRGTEIYIDAPQDAQAPVQFFTLEGKAQLNATAQSAPITVNQDQGVASGGAAAEGGGGEVSAPTLSVSQVKEEIKSSGMETAAVKAPVSAPGRPGSLSDSFGALPRLFFDPIQDRLTPVHIQYQTCNAVTGICN